MNDRILSSCAFGALLFDTGHPTIAGYGELTAARLLS